MHTELLRGHDDKYRPVPASDGSWEPGEL